MLVNAIQLQFTPLAVLSYMIMTLLYTPCIATLSIVGRKLIPKVAVFMALYTFAIGWVAAVVVFRVGSLLGFG